MQYLPRLHLPLLLTLPLALPAHLLLLLGHLEGQQSVGPLLPLRLHLHLPQGEEEEVVDPELVAAGDDVLLLPDPAGSGAPLPLPGHHTHGAGNHRVLDGLLWCYLNIYWSSGFRKCLILYKLLNLMAL